MLRLVRPTLDQILRFCGEAPVERVFLEDIARRGLGRFDALESDDGRIEALCHVGANLVPSGRGCGRFAASARRGNARMLIGEESAVAELWDEARRSLPRPREDRPGQPVYELREPPRPGATGLRAATPDDLDLLVPACASGSMPSSSSCVAAHDADAFRWRTKAQIDEGRSLIF